MTLTVFTDEPLGQLIIKFKQVSHDRAFRKTLCVWAEMCGQRLEVVSFLRPKVAHGRMEVDGDGWMPEDFCVEVDPDATPADCGLSGEPGGPHLYVYALPRGADHWETTSSERWPSYAGTASFHRGLCLLDEIDSGSIRDFHPDEPDVEYSYKFWGRLREGLRGTRAWVLRA